MHVSLVKRHRDHVESRLASIWERVLDVDVVMPQDNFFNLGGDSVKALIVCTRVKAEFGFRLSVNDMFEMPTVAQLATILRSGGQERPETNLVEIAAVDNDAWPLYFVHAAPGEVMFLRWIRPHTLSRTVHGVRASGFQLSVQPAKTVEEMAERYVDAILARSGTAPVMLAGYSAGGVIAYEMARRLAAAGVPVPYLGLVDPSVPDIEEADPESLLPRLMKTRLAFLLDLYQLPNSWVGRTDAVSALRDAGAVPADYSADLFERTLEIWARNVLATRCYRPDTPYQGPAVLYTSAVEVKGDSGQLGDFVASGDPYASEWGALLPTHTPVWLSAENHFEIMNDPQLFPRMRDDLDAAQAHCMAWVGR
ncbi:thioesterase domain-containing protein [Micromonospora sp. NPDC048170]|uniref:thioesterase domain-containing protein n=1 Tax=Micromonospora sp. NPDC048170 TaxID=3154819 RepID=UPI0033FA54EE